MLKFILQTTVGKKYWLLSLNVCNWKMLTIMMNSCGTFFYWLMTDVRKHVSQARAQKSRNVACEQALCLGKGWKKTEPFPSLSSRFFHPFPKQRACLHASGNAAKFFCFLQRNVLPESKKARVRLSYGRNTDYLVKDSWICVMQVCHENILLVSKYTWPMRAKGKFPVDLSVFSCMGAQW